MARGLSLMLALATVGCRSTSSTTEPMLPEPVFVSDAAPADARRENPVVAVGGCWERATIDEDGKVGWEPSLAVDAQGHAHVGLLRCHRRRPALRLERQRAMGRRDRGRAGRGRPHTVFGPRPRRKPAPGVLRRRQVRPGPCAAGGSGLELRDRGRPWRGAGASLQLDGDDWPTIAYLEVEHGDLLLATTQRDGEQRTVIDLKRGLIGFPALGLAPTGPLIAYYEWNRRDLRVARRSGTGWKIVTVDGEGDVGMYASLALRPDGRAVVAYVDRTRADLKVAFEPPPAGPRKWSMASTTPATGPPWRSVPMAWSTSLRGHDRGRFATPTTPAVAGTSRWSSGRARPGSHPAIALGAGQRPHIVHHDATTGRLRYAVQCPRQPD